MQIKQTQEIESFIKALPQSFVIKYTKIFRATTVWTSIDVTRNFQSIKPLSSTQSDIFNQLEEKLKQLEDDIIKTKADEIKELLKSVQPQYYRGELMHKINDLEKISLLEDLSTNIQETQFEPQIGTVYLIVFWSPWYPDTLQILDESEEMIRKNPQWQGQVKLIGISFNHYSKEIINLAEEKQWKNFEHYRSLNSWIVGGTRISYFFMDQLPYIALINKSGKIEYLGNRPDQISILEKRINEIIKGVENDVVYQESEQQENYQMALETLSYEEYKELKKSMLNFQNALNQEKFEGFVEVRMEKTIYWSQDGTKRNYKISKLQLRYDVKGHEEFKINAILENYWNQIPEGLKVIGQSKIRDPKRQIKELQQKYQQVYSTLGVEIQYFEVEKTNAKYDQYSNAIEVFQTSQMSISVSNLSVDQYKKGQENISEYLYEFDGLDQEVQEVIETIKKSLDQSVSLQVGDQFQAIKNYKKLGEDEFLSIEHQQGQIYLIVYWEYWSDNFYTNNLSQLKKLLEKNSTKWNETVKFIYLSQTLEEDTNQSYQDYQQYFSFYFPKTTNQDDKILYGASKFPYCIAVDKFGKIRAKDIVENIEELLDELIDEQSVVKKPVMQIEITEDNVEKVKGFLRDSKTNERLAEIDSIHIIELQIEIEIAKLAQQIQKKPQLILFCRDTQLEILKSEIFVRLFQFIPENYWEIRIDVVKQFLFLILGLLALYVKKIQQMKPNKHVCVECAEFDDKAKKGYERYKYQDTLIFINGPLTDLSVLQNIEEQKIGKNLKLKEGEEGSQDHSMLCSGCGGKQEGPRYISANAFPGKQDQSRGYIDFCQKCFLILKDKTSVEAQEIIQKNSQDGMPNDTLLVRILFNQGDYRIF